jgi:ATP-dependent exoDNAse (exonuclease V) beta subunit
MVMKLQRERPHERDRRLVFDEAPHVYYLDGTPVKTSVTTFIHSMFPHFNANKIAPFSHKKHFNNPDSEYYQLSVEEIKDLWENNRDTAATAGTKMHKSIELFYNEEPITTEMLESTEFQYFTNFNNDFKHLKPYRTEWEVFDEDHCLAGSIDMIYENPDGTLVIYDWKRSKEIKTENKYEKGYAPLDHLPNCNFWHYSLQLNTYKRILETNYGKTIVGLFLVILHPNNMNYIRLEVPDMQDTVQFLFDHRLKNLSA